MSSDLKIIKKKYGEEMMHLCRELFPSILEEEGKLSRLLLEHFEPNHDLYHDIITNKLIKRFKDYIYKLSKLNNKKIKSIKMPQELLSEVGYDLYECKTEGDIQKFKKYYAKDEELCTFNGNRLKYCRVFFAVKKDVDEIKREDYPNPERQDEYGTSVISIQFTKDGTNTLSIKNRYNHKVDNPDATFSNNLDNIIEGLTYSFESFYGIKQKYKQGEFEIPHYVQVGGKFYKYNYEINNIYYCPNNIIIDNFEVKQYEKEKYLIFDYFVFDLQNKKIRLYDNLDDCFTKYLENIKDIKIEKKENSKFIYITSEEGNIITLEVDKNSVLISYTNPSIKDIDANFLKYNKYLKSIKCNNAEKIGMNFLCHNIGLTKINFPKVVYISDNFLEKNRVLNELNLPLVFSIGDSFLEGNIGLKEINLPNVQFIQDHFLCENNLIHIVNCPNLENIGSFFMTENITLKKLSLPNVKYIKSSFLYYNQSLEELSLPNLECVLNGFLGINNTLIKIEVPNLKKVQKEFLYFNNTLKEFYAPLLKEVGPAFFRNNQVLQTVNLESLDVCDYLGFESHPFIKLEDIIKENREKAKKVGI